MSHVNPPARRLQARVTLDDSMAELWELVSVLPERRRAQAILMAATLGARVLKRVEAAALNVDPFWLPGERANHASAPVSAPATAQSALDERQPMSDVEISHAFTADLDDGWGASDAFDSLAPA